MPQPANPQSWNRFSYVRNNPIKYTDPTGHRICEDLDCNGLPSGGNSSGSGGSGSGGGNNSNPDTQLSVILSNFDTGTPWNNLPPEIRDELLNLGFGPSAWQEHRNGSATDVAGTLADPAVYLSFAVAGWASGLHTTTYNAALYVCLRSPFCAYLIGARELAKLPERTTKKVQRQVLYMQVVDKRLFQVAGVGPVVKCLLVPVDLIL